MDLDDILLEENEEVNPNAIKSVYREDFRKVSIERPDLIVHIPDFHDIIAGPYIDPLFLDSKISELDPSKSIDSADVVYKRVVSKYPSLKKVALSEVIDQSKLISEYRLIDKSIYQADYCNEGQSYESKYSRLRERVELPPDWGPVPKTIQKRSYREWKKLVKWTIKPAKTFKPPESELGVGAEEQKILNVTTGKSEYEANISDPGAEIIDYSFYGEVKILPHEFRKNND